MYQVYEKKGMLFKFLPCILISIYMVMFLIGSYVCAFNNDNIIISDYFGDEHILSFSDELSTGFDYIIIVRSDWDNYPGNFTIFLTNDINFSFTLGFDNSNRASYTFSCSEFYKCSSKHFDSYSNPFTLNSFTKYTNSYTNNGPSSYSVIYSNVDVYDSNHDLVFQSPPQKVEGITIPAIQSAEEIPLSMVQIMRILIPVGLIIFGIGLVIYLIKLVISRVQ